METVGMTVKVKEDKQLDRVLEFVGSSELIDRDQEVIRADGWELENYRKNPVVLFAHNYREPAVGKAIRVWQEKGNLRFKVQFPMREEYELADVLYKLYKGGYMNAVSVGFIPKEWEWGSKEDEPRRTYTRQELLELSLVPVPANPEALVTSRGIKSAEKDGVLDNDDLALLKEVLRELEAEKTVIPYKRHPLAPKDEAWDGSAQVREADVADLKVMCAWYDRENADIKQSYKLPHHRASDHYTVWRGVTAAMGALLGARGGVDIPESDRRGVYEHLARHYRDFDEEPPEFKELEEAHSACPHCGKEIFFSGWLIADLAQQAGLLEREREKILTKYVCEICGRETPVRCSYCEEQERKSYFDLLLQDLRSLTDSHGETKEEKAIDAAISALKSLKEEMKHG
ncbi:MAG: HK97 family phage prohead protease [Deltaproteobacteria bacterium]|nr:HK97 family phage prohead protease [Deltaproteobacteria bacterium]MBW2081681.1 HK97 family phage prohead protease [Deltaproteobacteria bacterium]MBW2298876.1 HK97 family phage prohead protease [Deltaproteobacteria bacterium]